ncbi:hypothetical protein G7Y79_00021g050490 [Physcia stellaris]|nr:hypothetical protein G7Y79_00021g050490 [Physcia stellaris]
MSPKTPDTKPSSQVHRDSASRSRYSTPSTSQHSATGAPGSPSSIKAENGSVSSSPSNRDSAKGNNVQDHRVDGGVAENASSGVRRPSWALERWLKQTPREEPRWFAGGRS